jgi:hypothetical protein
MTKIQNRYASAVHSSNLSVDGRTYMSDSDTLGAMGIADRVLTTGRTSDGTPVKPSPLAVPLERLFSGDNREAHEIVRLMAQMAHEHSFQIKVKISRAQCKDMAQACLAWHRNGTCKPCGGRSYSLIPGTKTLSDRECPECRGSGKAPLERQFRMEHRELARWMVAEMARAAGQAGPQAMRVLAPTLEL